ncbi:hypothetical protein [Tessaracoccus sp. Y1736]
METPDAPLYRVPDDIAWIDGTEIGLGEELYLTRLPSGETIQLKGPGRMIWLSATHDIDPIGAVAALVGRPRQELVPLIRGFMSSLKQDAWLANR